MSVKKRPFADINEIRQTREAVSKQPELGKVTFSLKGQSNGGISMAAKTGAFIQNGQADEGRIGKFTLVSDEPKALLGTDAGPTPPEHLLQALAGCYTVTLAAMAAEKGIELSGLECDLGIDIDFNGFFDLDKSVRKGAQGISVDLRVTSDTASRAEIEELIAELPNKSPIYDTIANPVKITTRLV
ncbi:Organic hydroperoxide reductase OsmC/OhrA [Rhizobium sp. NFR07]|uniref:OsmC family protein n=1 Tax=Rhizobium sp. NFR07 TaxID=1566262 RepID=UPI0008E6F3B0|nr:OsmC family protein [Rhizobium sp. NFR07]SFA79747.1 Organic hydroperoxide reductase OsmC/OhrA [Rhizobium sp. NFR07]